MTEKALRQNIPIGYFRDPGTGNQVEVLQSRELLVYLNDISRRLAIVELAIENHEARLTAGGL